jgi:hypothetical protein
MVRRPGSGLAEQHKRVDLDWKSSSVTTSSIGGFLQPADTPNVGAKSGGREEEEGINDPRSPQGGLYSE